VGSHAAMSACCQPTEDIHIEKSEEGRRMAERYALFLESSLLFLPDIKLRRLGLIGR